MEDLDELDEDMLTSDWDATNEEMNDSKEMFVDSVAVVASIIVTLGSFCT